MSVPFRTALRAEMLRRQIYDRQSVGCCLHVFLDDSNVQDEFVESGFWRAAEAGHRDCMEICLIAMQMSHTQRMKLSTGGYSKAFDVEECTTRLRDARAEHKAAFDAWKLFPVPEQPRDMTSNELVASSRLQKAGAWLTEALEHAKYAQEKQ